MISSVSRCIRGCSAIGSSAGQEATSRSATSVISPSSAAIFLPWNAGSISLRWLMWASSSSSSTELRPTIGSRMRAPWPGCSTSGGAVNTSFSSSGSEMITKCGDSGKRVVKRLP